MNNTDLDYFKTQLSLLVNLQKEQNRTNQDLLSRVENLERSNHRQNFLVDKLIQDLNGYKFRADIRMITLENEVECMKKIK